MQSAVGNTAAVRARIDLARKRVKQNEELASTGAGNRFDLEQSQTDLRDLEAQLGTAIANEAQVRAQLAAVVDGDIASIAKIKADLASAQWELQQTVVRSPCDCYVVNLQLRPGAFVAGMPFNPVMSLVESTGQVVALFHQNELHQIERQRGEFALATYPSVIKATVDSVIWAQGQGQISERRAADDGRTGDPPQGFVVKFDVRKRQGAVPCRRRLRSGAVYAPPARVHIIRRVILRVGAYTDYLILKLH